MWKHVGIKAGHGKNTNQSIVGEMRHTIPERRNRVKKEPGVEGACGFKELKKYNMAAAKNRRWYVLHSLCFMDHEGFAYEGHVIEALINKVRSSNFILRSLEVVKDMT